MSDTASYKFKQLSPDEKKPVLSDSLKKQPFVDEGSFYRMVIQVGPSMAWGKIRGSDHWIQRQPKYANDKEKVYDPEYVIYEVNLVDGETANGLISGSNEWISQNQRRDKNKPEGLINRMMVVLECQKVDHTPDVFGSVVAGSGIPMAVMAGYFENLANKIVAQKLAEMAKGKSESSFPENTTPSKKG